jgi:hypothetical protein
LLPLYNIKQQQQQQHQKTIKNNSDNNNNNNDDEQILLADTLDNFLIKIVEFVPTRLLLPSIVENTTSILTICSVYSIEKYVSLFENICNNLERSLIVSNLQDLSALATSFLDYRRLHGVQNDLQTSVDSSIASAIVTFCLKLTENELKKFLLKIAEWRDVLIVNNNNNNENLNYKNYSRNVVFYVLIEKLLQKLEVIFLPTLSLFWTNLNERLSDVNFLFKIKNKVESLKPLPKNNKLIDDEKKNNDDNDVVVDESTTVKSSKKKDKKRKLTIDETTLTTTTTNEFENENKKLQCVSHEILLQCKYIFNSIIQCCKIDTIGFIDEVFSFLFIFYFFKYTVHMFFKYTIYFILFLYCIMLKFLIDCCENFII